MKVAVMLRGAPEYPREELLRGIRAVGDTVSVIADYKVNAVVTWNNYGASKTFADGVKNNGGLHICMENGYLRREDGYFLMSINGFNGTEESDYDINFGPERFEKLGLSLKPWKKGGEYVLVCGQRGGNYSEMAMNNSWPDTIIQRIQSHTDRPIVYKPHPARPRYPFREYSNLRVVSPSAPLDHLIDNAFATVVYTSNVANQSLLRGTPVFYDGPIISCHKQAKRGVTEIEFPLYPYREQYFWDLAWKQWHKSEIERGAAWTYLTK